MTSLMILYKSCGCFISYTGDRNHLKEGKCRNGEGEGSKGEGERGRETGEKGDLAINSASRRLYISDIGNPWHTPSVPSTLYCLTLDGRVVYKYQDTNWRNGKGVYVDKSGKVYVCGFNSNYVLVVLASGTKHQLLFFDKDGIRRPSCIALRKADKILMVGCCNKLFTCKIDELMDI